MRKKAALVRSFLAFQQHKETCPYFPIQLRIEPTNLCNLECPMCPNSSIETKNKGFMKFGLYKQIINEIRDYAREVYMFHRGESLMHPKLFEMIRYANKSDLLTRLHTNATLLSKEKSYQLLRSGLDFISFSLDGTNKETYEKNRAGADFNKTVNNIIHFLKLKKKYNKAKPFTVIQILDIPNANIDTTKTKKFKQRFFSSMPLDEIRIIPLHNWAGNIKLTPSNAKGKIGICTFPWYSLTVFWDGTIVPCPQDFTGRLRLGNIKDASLRKIWNNEKMVHLRKKMIEGNYSDLKPCNTCDRPLRRKVLGSIPKQYLGLFISENVVGHTSKKILGKISI